MEKNNRTLKVYGMSNNKYSDRSSWVAIGGSIANKHKNKDYDNSSNSQVK